MDNRLTHATDAELVRDARGGDTAAFEALTARHFPMVYAVAYARLGAREAAEDLAQEVFLVAFLHLGALADPARFAAWLGRIARNEAGMWRRRSQSASRLVRLVPLDDLPAEPAAPASQEARTALEADEETRALHEALFRLPEALREVVLLHYFEGLSKAEIAERRNRELCLHKSGLRSASIVGAGERKYPKSCRHAPIVRLACGQRCRGEIAPSSGGISMQEKAARHQGFTLIELLIVVAIIAILATIAIPNFLEAQTRAKVARAKSDMQTISIGIEAFAVDNGNWPISTLKPGKPPQRVLQYATELTTPVAYLPTVLLKDPFKLAWSDVGGDGPPRPDFCGGYCYANWNGELGKVVMLPYTSFPCYVLSSVGPNGRYDQAFWLPAYQRFTPNDPNRIAEGLDRIYDATNGTNSGGDIPRFGGESGTALGM